MKRLWYVRYRENGYSRVKTFAHREAAAQEAQRIADATGRPVGLGMRSTGYREGIRYTVYPRRES